MTGQEIETIESRWGQSIANMFDTPESRVFAPDPHVWPAYLNPGAATVGHFRAPIGTIDSPEIIVHVNYGVWQTVCPFCPNAQHASHDDQRFYCARCHNEAAGFMSLPVVWPDEHAELGELLLQVNRIDLRNWEPHESLDEIDVQVQVYLASLALPTLEVPIAEAPAEPEAEG